MVTLVIPTKNRSDFLIRILRYYADTNYQYTICIGDSSEQFHLDTTKKFIDSLNGKLKIMYFEYPGLGISLCFKKLINQVKTPYAAIVLDDDFIIEQSLRKCVDFLENNLDYSSAGGRAIVFSLKEPGAHGEIKNVGVYSQRNIEGKTASQRLADHLKNYTVTLFSVHRIETWRHLWQNVVKSSERAFMEELIPCCLSVIHGKKKVFDDLYLVRQDHEQRAFHMDTYDWVTHQDWFNSYNIFHDSLEEALAYKDGISRDEAHGVIKEGFWKYLNKSFVSKYDIRYKTKIEGINLKKIIKRSPTVFNIANYIQLLFRRHLKVSTLLNKKSPYCSNFAAVYRAVTEKPLFGNKVYCNID
ncbi:MAG: TIGR00180 family glycosyltransferase [Candidatus Omnitrophica bacterium]|nr:TIGR00180 family glycosyltransferase [Candidatus Omnitrophota bacterium]